jgi:hypothetical protein
MVRWGRGRVNECWAAERAFNREFAVERLDSAA